MTFYPLTTSVNVFVLTLWTSYTLYAQKPVNMLNIEGDQESVRAASLVLENAGGKAVWEKSTFIAYEKAYLKSGSIAHLKITRNLEQVTRKIESKTDGSVFVEVIGTEMGCTWKDGTRELLENETLAMERQGLSQSPYYIYHRLAKEDPSLRVDLVDDGNKLDIYQNEDQLLCWFLIDGKGQQYSWGNIYNGRINQHYYGPYKMMGDAILPSWGTSMDGGFRFEYLMSEFREDNIILDCLTAD